ncbi:MAG: peptide deformylase [Bacilli bacterium]
MILTKDIIQQGHKTLKLKAKEISFPLSKENIKIANSILSYIKNSTDEEISKKYDLRAAVGLAAPQINHSIKMMGIVIPKVNEDSFDFEHIFINPKIISHSEQMCYLSSGEGCLSVKENVSGFVPRYKKITIEAYNIDGEKFTMRLKDFYSIVFQHEYDHLDGILFTEKITDDVSGIDPI